MLMAITAKLGTKWSNERIEMRKLKFGDKVIYENEEWLVTRHDVASNTVIIVKPDCVWRVVVIEDLMCKVKHRPRRRELRTEIAELKKRIAELEAENGKGEVETKTITA